MHTNVLELFDINHARIIDRKTLCIVDNNQVIWQKGLLAYLKVHNLQRPRNSTETSAWQIYEPHISQVQLQTVRLGR
jgi:hypothetical protein